MAMNLHKTCPCRKQQKVNNKIEVSRRQVCLLMIVLPCTELPHNLIKEKLLDLIEWTFYKKEGKLYLACNDKKAFFTSIGHYRGYHLLSFQNVCDALSFLLGNIYIRFCTKLYRQIVGIPMATNCAPLVADLFLFSYERDFMKDLSSDTRPTL